MFGLEKQLSYAPNREADETHFSLGLICEVCRDVLI